MSSLILRCDGCRAEVARVDLPLLQNEFADLLATVVVMCGLCKRTFFQPEEE